MNPCVNFNSTLVQEAELNPITLNDYPHEVLVISQLRVCNRKSASMFFMITFTAGVSIRRIDGLQTNIASYVCTLSWIALGWSFLKVFQGDGVRPGDIVHAKASQLLLVQRIINRSRTGLSPSYADPLILSEMAIL